MASSRNRLSRFLTDARPPRETTPHTISTFYREEFLKCQQGLERQREFYSERAICDVERALTRVMAQLDRLCAEDGADLVVSRLLRQFDVLAGLSDWSDPRQTH